MEDIRTNQKILRGEIYDIGVLDTEGSEQQGCRPVLIVSCDSFNEWSPEVVILFITSQLDKRGNRYHINLPGVDGLEKKSMVLAEQIRTIDKARLIRRRGRLDMVTMNRVDRGLRTILDLLASEDKKKALEEEKKEQQKVFDEWRRRHDLKEKVRRSSAANCKG